jgi:hypothetical protein
MRYRHLSDTATHIVLGCDSIPSLSKSSGIRTTDLIARLGLNLQREMVRPRPPRQLIDKELFTIWRNTNVQTHTNVQRLEACCVEALKAAINMESKRHQLIVVRKLVLVPIILVCDTSSTIMIAPILKFEDFGLTEVSDHLVRPPRANGMHNVWRSRAVVAGLGRNEDAELAKGDE